jgi:hypothetical protein
MADQLTFCLRLRCCALLGLALRLCDVGRRIRSVIEGSGLLQLNRNIDTEFLRQACLRTLVQLPRGLSFGRFRQQFAQR